VEAVEIAGVSREEMVVDVSMQEDPDILIVKNMDFVAFIAASDKLHESNQSNIIVKAANRCLDLQDFTADMLQGLLNKEVPLPRFQSLCRDLNSTVLVFVKGLCLYICFSYCVYFFYSSVQ
jgi:hypothetical protein